jgi:hypothetical protein
MDPEGGERCIHRALERRHQVRRDLISTRGRVQLGSGFGVHVQHDQRTGQPMNIW